MLNKLKTDVSTIKTDVDIIKSTMCSKDDIKQLYAVIDENRKDNAQIIKLIKDLIAIQNKPSVPVNNTVVPVVKDTNKPKVNKRRKVAKDTACFTTYTDPLTLVKYTLFFNNKSDIVNETGAKIFVDFCKSINILPELYNSYDLAWFSSSTISRNTMYNIIKPINDGISNDKYYYGSNFHFSNKKDSEYSHYIEDDFAKKHPHRTLYK